MNSKFLANLWGVLHGGGQYNKILSWLKKYSENNSPKLLAIEDCIIGTDNEQRLGKTYVTSINSSLTTSVISVIVAFILNLKLYCQYIKSGCTSMWRFGEKKYSKNEKKNILAKALLGREKGAIQIIDKINHEQTTHIILSEFSSKKKKIISLKIIPKLIIRLILNVLNLDIKKILKE